MIDKKKTCPDCDAPMSVGFLLDETYGSRHPLFWVEGEVESSYWTGTKLKGRTIYHTQTFRCVKCGLLKSYTTEKRT